MVFADMDIAQPVTDIAQRPHQIVLLDVHVVGVEMDHDIVGTDVVDQRESLPRRVDDMGLVAVADLDAEHHADAGRLLGQILEHGHGIRPAPGADRLMIFAEGAESAPVSTRPPSPAVASTEALSSSAPRWTTAGSSLETSASNASPREQATCKPALSRVVLAWPTSK